MPSPALTVMLAGSNRYPFASPIIFTSTVLPVIAAIVPAAAGAAEGVAAGAGATVVVSVATPTVSVALLLSPPAQALMTAVLAATASVMKRISNLACMMECWMLPNDSFFL